MINILKMIADVDKDKQLESININELNRITFQFLEIKGFGDPEDLYVKMNSRGKSLSKWDIFKSNLIEAEIFDKSEDSDVQSLDETFLDKWYNIYKCLIKDDEETNIYKNDIIENIFYNISYNSFILEFISKNDDSLVKSTDLESLDINTNKFINDISDQTSDSTKKDFTKKTVKNIISFIKFFYYHYDEIIEFSFSRFTNKGLRINEVLSKLKEYQDDKNRLEGESLFLFATYYFYISNHKDLITKGKEKLDINEIENLMQAIRISSNLIRRVNRYDFTGLNTFCANLTEYINSNNILEDLSIKPYDTNSNLHEEAIKAKWLLNNDNKQNFEDLIYKIENRPETNGTLQYIINILGDEKAYNSDFEQVNKIDEFFFKNHKDCIFYTKNGLTDEFTDEFKALISYYKISENKFTIKIPRFSDIRRDEKDITMWNLFENKEYQSMLKEFYQSNTLNIIDNSNNKTILNKNLKSDDPIEWLLYEDFYKNLGVYRTVRFNYQGSGDYIYKGLKQGGNAYKFQLQLCVLSSILKTKYKIENNLNQIKNLEDVQEDSKIVIEKDNIKLIIRYSNSNKLFSIDGRDIDNIENSIKLYIDDVIAEIKKQLN